MKTIWALTSVANLYDQPPNNLVAWWSEKPTLDQVCDALGMGKFPPQTDQAVLQVVNIWSGKTERIGSDISGTDFSLSEIKEGKL
ncbi:hypothetical protein [Inquilinus limosus]|uniref:Uncharacterized protein n=1 Tax=Inquilinus limosus MP06 TaxID=1398085 RepID=A0A0A0DGQ0_9PROT|nr:hypothetical protein [Inquilinus limosus]KGM36177.1 hypothetical protein P409_00585 [Inquilinus limosus MP06]